MNQQGYIREVKCAECGKTILINGDWGYKIGNKYYCTYSHMKIAEKKPTKNLKGDNYLLYSKVDKKRKYSDEIYRRRRKPKARQKRETCKRTFPLDGSCIQ